MLTTPEDNAVKVAACDITLSAHKIDLPVDDSK